MGTYESAVEEQKNNQTQMLARMEEIRARVIAASAIEFRQWIDKVMQHFIKTRGDDIVALGASGVGELKRDLQAFKDNVESDIQKAFGTKTWPHLLSDPTGVNSVEKYTFHANSPGRYDEQLRFVYSTLAKIFEKFGLLGREASTYIVTGDVASQFGTSFKPSDGVMSMLNDYKIFCGDVKRSILELDRLKQNEASIKAQELWDAA